MARSPLPIIAALLSASALLAEPASYFLQQGGDHDPSVTTPREFLGWDVGDWHVKHAQLHSYFRELERTSPRVKLEYYAQSHEGNPLFHAIITSPENHARLEAIREEHLKLADPAQSASLDVSAMPLVAVLGYSIHGNEPSGASASMLVAYHLASSLDEETLATLGDTVILMDPCLNPDGLDRFATWVNSHKSTRPSEDPADREHNEVWPRGRTNHYWFDLNRDWLPLVHPESRGRVTQFHRWKPNLLTDHHEMGTDTTYFFQPGVPTRENPSSPDIVAEFTRKIAEHHAVELDRIGSLYYTREVFDDFYPGKGSTYPDINGGVGILFEQASARGHAQESVHGTITFPFTIRNQVTTSFTSIRGARAIRTSLLEHQRDFFKSAASLAEKTGIEGWVIDGAEEPAKTWHFLDVLRTHDIEVRALEREFSAGGRTYSPGSAWFVPAAQPQFRLATEIFARRTDFEDPLFYDVSAWNLPLAYNLPYEELKSGAMPAGTVGGAIGQPFFPAGRVMGGGEAYAYVFEWSGYYAPRALQRLHRAGVLVKIATRAFDLETDEGRRHFEPGAVLVAVGPQSEKRGVIEDVVASIAREDAITVCAVGSGHAVDGLDLGSPGFTVVKAPVVAILAGEGVDSLDAGAAWHLLDIRVGLPPTLLDPARISAANLARHTVIVMSDGGYSGFSNAQVTALKDWVKAGGTLVAGGQALEFLAKEEFARIEFARAATPENSEQASYGAAPRLESLKLIRGAIFNAEIDLTHPLFFGYSRGTLPVFKNNRIFVKTGRLKALDPAVFGDKPLIGGYVSAENIAAIAGSSAVQVSHLGSGRIIMMPDNPNFRGMWLGGSKFFLNSIFLPSLVKPVAPGGNFTATDAHDH